MATEEQLLEIHRLAMLGGEAGIARDLTRRLAGPWLGVSRFREVAELCQRTLKAGPDARTLNSLARAKQVLGEVVEAMQHYRAALEMDERDGDRCVARRGGRPG